MLTPVIGTVAEFTAPAGTPVIMIATVSGGTANSPGAQYNGFVLPAITGIQLGNGEFAVGFQFNVLQGSCLFSAVCLFTTLAPSGQYHFSELINSGGVPALVPLGTVINAPTSFPLFGITIHGH